MDYGRSTRTTARCRSTLQETNWMNDCRGDVQALLERGVVAGLAPAMVAEWGRPREKPLRKVLGASTLRPTVTSASARTWFDLASLTKPLVTTTLSLLALRSTELRPTMTVGEVLHEVRNSAVGHLQLRQLLTHTSGLPDWLPLYCVAEGRPRDLLRRLGEVRLVAAPGSRVIYSCVGFVVLGMILTRVSGSALDVLFQKEVVDALDLGEELGFCPDSRVHSLAGGASTARVERRLILELGLNPRWIPPIATSLPDDGNARFLGGVAGNAGLFGTAYGVSSLAAEYLPGGGRLLTSKEAEVATSSSTGGLEQERGFGWQLAPTSGCSAGAGLSREAFGHTGFTGVSVWADPSNRGVFVLLTNRNHPEQREIDLHPLRRRFHVLAGRTLES